MFVVAKEKETDTSHSRKERRGDSHMKQTGMFVGNFELDP